MVSGVLININTPETILKHINNLCYFTNVTVLENATPADVNL